MKLSDPSPSRRWALYRSHLHHEDQSLYMKRYIARWAGRTWRVHGIMSSDQGRDFHDHPFDFVSRIVWGGYLEHRPGCDCAIVRGRTVERTLGGPCRWYRAGDVVRRQAEELHRIEIEAPVWTFVRTGPYKRKWGFQTSAGWIYHRDYKVQMS
jgi:hypothetical protein